MNGLEWVCSGSFSLVFRFPILQLPEAKGKPVARFISRRTNPSATFQFFLDYSKDGYILPASLADRFSGQPTARAGNFNQIGPKSLSQTDASSSVRAGLNVHEEEQVQSYVLPHLAPRRRAFRMGYW